MQFGGFYLGMRKTQSCLNTSAATHIYSLQIYSSQGEIPDYKYWECSGIAASSLAAAPGVWEHFGSLGSGSTQTGGSNWQDASKTIQSVLPGRRRRRIWQRFLGNRLNLASQLVIYSVCRKDVGTQPIPASPVYIVSDQYAHTATSLLCMLQETKQETFQTKITDCVRVIEKVLM